MPHVSRTNHQPTMPTSILNIRALSRPAKQHGGGAIPSERQSWDFVVDGRSLRSVWSDRDVAGVLGWGTPETRAEAAAKLRGEVPPDYIPNRVAIFVCPECGDLGCGAVTVSIIHERNTVTWSDFRWEVNWFADHPNEATVLYELGPFVFSVMDYTEVLERALATQPQAG
jgi:hypothetical protein